MCKAKHCVLYPVKCSTYKVESTKERQCSALLRVHLAVTEAQYLLQGSPEACLLRSAPTGSGRLTSICSSGHERTKEACGGCPLRGNVVTCLVHSARARGAFEGQVLVGLELHVLVIPAPQHRRGTQNTGAQGLSAGAVAGGMHTSQLCSDSGCRGLREKRKG